jgi:mannosyl-3-phosphoglycerate synthase
VLQLPSLANSTPITFNGLEGNHFQHTPRNGNMRLTRPSRSCKLGLLHIAEEVRVLELDARAQDGGHANGNDGRTELGPSDTVCFPRDTLDDVLSEMVIVVPCKNEELPVIRGVISAIPAACLVILVSNCERRDGDDQYMKQVAVVRAFGGYRRQILAIHQKDLKAAAAFEASGMSDLVDPVDGTIRNGKGEGMLLGIALAAAFCPERRYIGFVDADNFNAGSVNEYCKAFAAGFAMAGTPDLGDVMVRLRWSSKPKMVDGRLDFIAEGRCSKIVNSWLNKLFAPTSDHENGSCRGSTNGAVNNPFVTTGNAGEHAMTLDLALKLRMAAGYAIEPFHFIDLLKRGHLKGLKEKQDGGTTNGTNNNNLQLTTSPLNKPVRVLQVRTLSPHFHRSSGDDHIRRMWASGLGSIYHGLASHRSISGKEEGSISSLREDMHAFAAENGGIDPATGELPQPKIYPALETIDLANFRRILKPSLGKESLRAFGFKGWEQG